MQDLTPRSSPVAGVGGQNHHVGLVGIVAQDKIGEEKLARVQVGRNQRREIGQGPQDAAHIELGQRGRRLRASWRRRPGAQEGVAHNDEILLNMALRVQRDAC